MAYNQQTPELAQLYQFKTGMGKVVKPATEESWQRAQQLLSNEQEPADVQGHPLSSWPLVSVVRA